MNIYRITQTETFTYKAESEAELIELFNAGVIDASDTINVNVELVEAKPLPTWTFLSGETYDVKAESLKEAQSIVCDYLASEDSPLNHRVTEGETLTELISRPCLECPPDSQGWHKNDDAGVTFEGLKKAQNEAILKGVQMVIDYMEEINLHSGANVAAELFDLLNDGGTFWTSHALYSTECENNN